MAVAATALASPPPVIRSSEDTASKICLGFDRSNAELVLACEDAQLEYDHAPWQRAKLLINLGYALNNLDRFEQSRKSFDKALLLEPFAADAVEGKAWSYWDEEKYDLAETLFRQALQFESSAAVYSGLASSIRLGGGDLNLALTMAERAMVIDPEHLWGKSELGWVLFALDRYDQAADEFLQVLELDPEYQNAAYGLSFAEHSRGNHQKAVSAINIAIGVDNQFAIYFVRRALLFRKNGSGNKALSDARRAVVLDPEYDEALVEKALAFSMLGRDVEALETLQAAVERGMKSNSIFYQLASFLSDQEKWAEALVALDQGMMLDGVNGYDHNLRAYIMLSTDKPEQALIAVNKALALKSDDATAWVYGAYAYVALQDNDKAMAYIVDAKKAGLSDHRISDFIGDLFGQGKYIFAALVRIEMNK